MHGLSGAILGDLLEFLVIKHVVGIFSKKKNPDVFKWWHHLRVRRRLCTRVKLARPTCIMHRPREKSGSDSLFSQLGLVTWSLHQAQCSEYLWRDGRPGCFWNGGYQGWIQTSATSFQKLVRIVKKLKKKHARKSQPLYANSSQVFNYRIF